jgi:hypothetical protein
LRFKRCSRCKIRRVVKIGDRGPRGVWCILCIREYDRERAAAFSPEVKEQRRRYHAQWRKDNKPRLRANAKARYMRLRVEVIRRYGGKCRCCGESRFQFLAIDHIHGGGRKHRKEIGGPLHMAAWLVRNRFPPGFRVLCHNCNMAIGFYGACPHKTEKKNAA